MFYCYIRFISEKSLVRVVKKSGQFVHVACVTSREPRTNHTTANGEQPAAAAAATATAAAASSHTKADIDTP